MPPTCFSRVFLLFLTSIIADLYCYCRIMNVLSWKGPTRTIESISGPYIGQPENLYPADISIIAKSSVIFFFFLNEVSLHSKQSGLPSYSFRLTHFAQSFFLFYSFGVLSVWCIRDKNVLNAELLSSGWK